MTNIDSIEITEELMMAVALAQLYREDEVTAIKKMIKEKLTSTEMTLLYRKIITNDKFPDVKQDAINLECKTLVDDNLDTIMLYYNKLLRQAQHEGKFDVATRILKEIRQIRAIDNEQQRYEINIVVSGMDETRNNAHSRKTEMEI